MSDKNKNLVEDTTGAAHPDVAVTDQNLSADQMFQQTKHPSLGRQIFSIAGLEGPTGAVFNIRQKDGSDDIELLRENVEVYPSESIPTGLTKEVIQDIRSQFGKDADLLVGTLLRGLANDQENTRTLAFLDTYAGTSAALSLTNSGNAWDTLNQITQKVQELVLKANSKNPRTFDAYAVLPYTTASAVMAALNNAKIDTGSHGLFIGSVGRTNYFMNPDATATKGFVGLKDNYNPSRSGAIFSPYQSAIIEAIDPDSGDVNLRIFNRFAITKSPLHVAGNEMFFKFDIS